MIKILKNLKDFKMEVFLIVGLLILQAYCDLSLPEYMSQIVDIGIQQGGIEWAAPEQMREETYENLSVFMTEEEQELMEQFYVLSEDSIYKRTTDKAEQLEQIDEAMGVPMVMVSYIEEASEGTGAQVQEIQTEAMDIDMDSLKAMLASGMITKEQILEMEEQALEQLGDLSDSIISQKAVLFVQEEYEAIGMDMGDVQMTYLWKTGAKMLGLAVIMVICMICVGYVASQVGGKLGANLRRKVFDTVVSFSNEEIEQFSTASLITRSTNDIQQVQMVAVMMLRMIAYAPIVGIGGIIKVSNTKTGMGWIIGVGVGAIILLIGILMVVAMPKFKKMQTLVDRVNLVSREILTGVSVIRAFSRETHEEKRFDKANTDLMKTQLFTNHTMNFMMPVMNLIMNGITILIVWFGAQGVDLGNLQVGDMMAFISYTMQIVMSFLMLTMIFIMVPRAGVAAGRIEEVINTKTTIKDKEQTKDALLEECEGVVAFEDVSFQYPGADECSLKHITFTANPGETTAIIGSTGCGKSTLMHLIERFYDVTEGKITLDGVDIRDLSQEKLRSVLGFVPQKGVLFSGNIASNIKFGGDWITNEGMVEAAQIAQAEEFISAKPDGYKSMIAQGGTNVSGGQKQRLSIARAIAKRPKVFLFDDSFSALDYKTDVVLRKALNEKISDATVIIVAQRISTILHADTIIVLEEGKIAGIGTHQQLLKNCEAYQEIAKSQLSEAELKGGVA